MMKFPFRFVFATAFLFLAAAAPLLRGGEDSAISPYSLTVESLTAPLGIDAAAPRLAWKCRPNQGGYGFEQSAYQILAASSLDELAKDHGDLWDSGWQESPKSIQVPYGGKELASGMRVFWKVRVKDQNGNSSDWSSPAQWTVGIVKAEDWKAEWIAQPAALREPVSLDGVSWIGDPDAGKKKTYLRRHFTLNITPDDVYAKNYSGIYYYAGDTNFQLYVNGLMAGHSIGPVSNPELVRSIDVTDYLRMGENVVAAIVETSDDAKRPAFLGFLDVRQVVPIDNVTLGRGTLGDPLVQVKTDSSWKVVPEKMEHWAEREVDDTDFANAVSLWEPEKAPWGKLRRFGEKLSPAFRKEFTLAEKKVKSAFLSISGLGFYEASLDGKRVGKRLLDPALTRYDRRVLYSTYDLTEQLNTPNRTHRFDVLLGHGWYDVRSVVTWNFDAAPWRGVPRLLAQLDVVYEDGTHETVATDESWDCVTSPIIFDCIRQGEIVDGGFEQKLLGKAEKIEAPKGKLAAASFPGTMIVTEFPAASVFAGKEEGTWIVDLGRNIAGWCRIKLNGLEKGKVVRFRYSERLKEGGIERFDLERHFMEGTPIYYVGERGGFQTDFYIAGGNSTETFEPRFTYNGFQYIEVKGLSEKPNPEDFTACTVSNGFPETGFFLSSNELINAIQRATLSSYRANFVDGYPTDCPHREKNGWTGDAHLAAEQAMYNWKNDAAYEKWVADLRDEQRPDGNLPGIVPTGGWGYTWGNGPAWDSSLVLIPWYLYIYRGDIRILEESYDAMKLYVDYMTTREDNENLLAHGLGDWCAYKDMPPVQVTSTGYYYVDTMIVTQTAKLLGKTEDAEKYGALALRIRKNYIDHLIDRQTGVCSDGSLAAQACAIHQGITLGLSESEQEAVFERLLDRMAKVDNHFDCGIFGVKYLPRTLSEGGRTDLALSLMLQESAPSFASFIRRGAGTLWEDWYQGSSRNHIMFGDVSAWFYQYLGGIRLLNGPYAAVGSEPGETAFREVLIAPECRKSDVVLPDREPLTKVEAQVDTPYGLIISKWNRDMETGVLSMEVNVPVGVHALIAVPVDEGEEVVPDASIPQEITARAEKGTLHGKSVVRYPVGSGYYRFSVLSGNK